MLRHASAVSRRATPELLLFACPRIMRAQGRPGGRCTRGSRAIRSCASAKTTGTGGSNRPSLRSGLRLIRTLPGEPALATVVPAGPLESRKNLARAWARQDHTISPSAKVPHVIRHILVHRIPLHVRDDAYAPGWCGVAQANSKFGKKEREIFLRRNLERRTGLLRFMKFGVWRKRLLSALIGL